MAPIVAWQRASFAGDLVGRRCGLVRFVSMAAVGWSGHHEWSVNLVLEKHAPDEILLLDLGMGTRINSLRIVGAAQPVDATMAASLHGTSDASDRSSAGVVALQLCTRS